MGAKDQWNIPYFVAPKKQMEHAFMLRAFVGEVRLLIKELSELWSSEPSVIWCLALAKLTQICVPGSGWLSASVVAADCC